MHSPDEPHSARLLLVAAGAAAAPHDPPSQPTHTAIQEQVDGRRRPAPRRTLMPGRRYGRSGTRPQARGPSRRPCGRSRRARVGPVLLPTALVWGTCQASHIFLTGCGQTPACRSRRSRTAGGMAPGSGLYRWGGTLNHILCTPHFVHKPAFRPRQRPGSGQPRRPALRARHVPRGQRGGRAGPGRSRGSGRARRMRASGTARWMRVAGRRSEFASEVACSLLGRC